MAQIPVSAHLWVSCGPTWRAARLMTLLCLSTPAEGAVEVAGEVALDAAADLLVGLALGPAALDVGQGRRVIAHTGDGDDVQGAVELAVAEAVEPVAVGPAGRDGDRCS